MMNYVVRTALTFLVCIAVNAQEFNVTIPGLTDRGKRELAKHPIPDFTRGGKKGREHDWNLGPTGARGWMWGMRLHSYYARQILITKVEKGSPADGVLKKGDVILGIGKRHFTSDARVAFGRAITEAEKTANKGRLQLLRWRPSQNGPKGKGKTQTVVVKLKVMGSYGKLAPFNCPKSRRILDDACKYIVRKKIGDGMTGHVNAMALLASGKKKYLPMVRDFARGLKVKDTYDMSSWRMSYMNIFLSEYYLLTGDKKVLPKLRHMALYLAKGQSQVGTWGHGGIEKNGLLGGYGAMCTPTLNCAISLKLNEKCGIRDEVVTRAIKKSEIFFLTFVNRGNIPYGDGSPRDDVHDHNGRAATATIFYDLLNNPAAYSFFARMTIASYGECEDGHCGNYWGMLWGPLGALRAGPEAAAAFIKEHEWLFELERRWDGGFTYQGAPGTPASDHSVYGWDTTGARALMYAMPLHKLYLTGRGLKLDRALTGKKLKDTMFAGRGFSFWLKEGLIDKDHFLDGYSTKELMQHLKTWSPVMCVRVAKALARKPGNHVPDLMKMLKSHDRETLLGGIYGLEYQAKKAIPAIDALVALLSHDDIWIRFRAGAALCAIGKPARAKAVPVLLKMAVVTSKDDPREMHQRFTSFVLWGGGVNGEPHGLLERDMSGVDPALLTPAFRKIIRNTDGQTRGTLEKVLKKLSPEQVEPLWPDILWAVENPAPSGIMFNSWIREGGTALLAKNRIIEGIPVIAKYISTMKQHGSEHRIYTLMDKLKEYGAAAKPQLPTLYKARKYYDENLGPGKPLEFPTYCRKKFLKGLDDGIKAIENAKEAPKGLRHITDVTDNP